MENAVKLISALLNEVFAAKNGFNSLSSSMARVVIGKHRSFDLIRRHFDGIYQRKPESRVCRRLWYQRCSSRIAELSHTGTDSALQGDALFSLNHHCALIFAQW